MKGRRPSLALVSAGALLCPIAGLGQTPVVADSVTRQALEAKADPARGKAVFEEDCAPCHRKDASGRVNGSVPRLSGQHAAVIVKQIVDIRSGRRLNPPMKVVLDDAGFSAQTIADVAGYLQGLPLAGALGKGPGKDVARGKALYDKNCVECHGANGEGRATKFVPMVAAQHHGYLLRELNLIRNGERGNSDPAMVKVLERYAADDLQALADFMSQLPVPKR